MNTRQALAFIGFPAKWIRTDAEYAEAQAMVKTQLVEARRKNDDPRACRLSEAKAVLKAHFANGHYCPICGEPKKPKSHHCRLCTVIYRFYPSALKPVIA